MYISMYMLHMNVFYGAGVGDIVDGEAWQDVWTALALADNDVPDPLGQLHRPPDQLRAMQRAGLQPVRTVPWLWYGQNWHGNGYYRYLDGRDDSDSE